MSKRANARKALKEWLQSTTPEMFIEQHKGVNFSKVKHDIKVDLVENKKGKFNAVD